ncbi:MAG: C40 family peptidase [Bacteroidota bacterium]
MDSGICTISIIPVRAEPSHKSELITQLLFGELYKILEYYETWIKIKTVFDSFEGWIDAKQGKNLCDEEFDFLVDHNNAVTSDLVQNLFNKSTQTNLQVVMGSSLPNLKFDTAHISLVEYIVNSESIRIPAPTNGSEIVDVALKYLNAPYLWGGRTPFGTDCSGFTQIVMKICGIPVFRNASQQSVQGTTVDFISEGMPGDLVYFENIENQIVHTGILINNQTIIHASGKVRIDPIDHEGIFNHDMKCYSHKLRLIRRFV